MDANGACQTPRLSDPLDPFLPSAVGRFSSLWFFFGSVASAFNTFYGFVPFFSAPSSALASKDGRSLRVPFSVQAQAWDSRGHRHFGHQGDRAGH